MTSQFSRFFQERQYPSNVSQATIEWYRHSFKWLRGESPSQEDLKDAVLRMRAKGMHATGCNSAIRAINAYLHWSANPNIKCSQGCSHVRVPYLLEPLKVLPTFTEQQAKLLVSYRPKGFFQRRLDLIVLVLLDTGCRIDEVLSLRVADADLDNLLFTITGKGRKQRRIPFSFELSPTLAKFMLDYLPMTELIVATRRGRKLGRRNVLRNVKANTAISEVFKIWFFM